MKKASREKDQSKIMTLGPYALALSYILTKAKSDSLVFIAYRGMRIPKKVFATQFGYENEGINNSDEFNLSRCESEVLLGMNKVFTSQTGFQCTSLEKDVALNFAKPPEKKEDLDKQAEES